MFYSFILFSFSNSKPQNTLKDFNSMVSRMEGPSFIEINTKTDMFDLNKKYDLGKVITGKQKNEKVRQHEYFKSTITIKSATFTKSFAFGTGITASGSGGAIYVSYCNLFVEKDSTFSTNKANVGGSICSIKSTAYINLQNAEMFSNNVAYKFGGAIFFQGLLDEVAENKKESSGVEDKSTLTIKGDTQFNAETANYNFVENKAGELGGAICLSLCKVASLKDCYFLSNTAEISGGAISSLNANLACTHCVFNANYAALSTATFGESKATSDTNNFQLSTPVFSGKGGGAIFFTDNKYYLGFNKNDEGNIERLLYTEGCCFYGNKAERGTNFNKGPGHELMFDGFTRWSSYIDFGDFNDKSVSISTRNGHTPSLNYIDFNKDNSKCGGLSGGGITVDGVDPTFATTSRSKGSNIASKVPSPSIYTYQATPVPETPYATTSSWSKYITRTAHEPPTMPIAKKTLINTPFRSPMKSATPIPYFPPLIPSGHETSTFSTNTWIITNITLTESIDEDGNTINITTSTVTGLFTPTIAYVIVNNDSNAIVGEILNNNLYIIIGSVIGGLVFIIVIAIIIWLFVVKKSSNSSSLMEIIDMEEETIIGAQTLDDFTVSNPLWTTSVVNNEDDPFCHDFEEEVEEKLFINNLH